ncbi:flippase activity-associated protein Agl23 [Halomarina salina]|uniref:Flippase activity-associated protein Agl23 n=1 Tax=Halomarina salina TaxID=1872699 RepID=A0ABD5RIP7_9EURY|nr:flippase activity-associated protein Agl23 [Halomarina salina]
MAVGPSRDASAGTDRRAVLGVCALTVAALLVRFVDLGGRVAHWDEGRVGFWILDYVETGQYTYRPIIHGPFFHHVTPFVFDLLGTTDAAMRVVPALLTGLLPLVALLFRQRLDDAEVVSLAFFLGFTPLVVYYGRFMRGDPVVGAFMLVAFALFVRFVDTRLYRYLFTGVAFAALGFTVKENAPVYVLCWLGGLAVYGYLLLFAARRAGERPIRSWLRARRDHVASYDWSSPQRPDGGEGTTGWRASIRQHLDARNPALRALYSLGIVALCSLLFLAIVVLFYAPRGSSGVTIGTTLADPLQFPALVEEATLGSFDAFYDLWGDGGQSEHAYLPYLEHLVGTLGAGALVLSVLAVVGFLSDSVREGGARPLVVVSFLWGLASVFGYPVITDIKAPWAAIHVVVPWTIPAAVGMGTIVRWGRESLAHDDRVGVGLAIAAVLLLCAFPVYVTYDTTFANPQAESNDLVQYAQPAADVHPEMTAIERLAERNEGTDVVLYGDSLVEGDPIYQRPTCAGNKGWFNALPLPWYLERADAQTACAEDLDALDSVESGGEVPVVVSTLEHRAELEQRYPDYTVTVRGMRLWGSEWVFLVDTSRFPEGENPLAGVESSSVSGEDPSGAVNGSGANGGPVGTPPTDGGTASGTTSPTGTATVSGTATSIDTAATSVTQTPTLTVPGTTTVMANAERSPASTRVAAFHYG